VKEDKINKTDAILKFKCNNFNPTNFDIPYEKRRMNLLFDALQIVEATMPYS